MSFIEKKKGVNFPNLKELKGKQRRVERERENLAPPANMPKKRYIEVERITTKTSDNLLQVPWDF